MLYTKEEVLEYVSQEDVKFIRLAFCDVFGVPKNISIQAGELERAFDYGVSFDASAIKGFGGQCQSDLFLFPDPSTLCVLPWRPSHGSVVRMFCEIRYPDGRKFSADSREILKRAIACAAQAGLSCYFGAEHEFYLFKTDENGNATTIPMDTAGYMDIAPEDAGENVRRDICLTLEAMGIAPEASHHEEGPGQNEIDFRYSDPLSSADNSITFKTVVKTVAAKNGLYASFDPKPLKNVSGSGMHINMSLVCPNGKACFDPFMAGILEHASEMTLFLNTSAQSYMRLGNHKAPKYITWSAENRSQLIRIPASAAPQRRRIELRSPDATANPYLAYALLIYAGLDGIERGLTPPPAQNSNLYTASDEALSALTPLPDSLAQAAETVRNNDFILKHLPKLIVNAYLSLGE